MKNDQDQIAHSAFFSLDIVLKSKLSRMAFSEKEVRFKGIAVSPGVCHGPVLLLDPKSFHIPRYRISTTGVKDEMHRFKKALVKTREELQSIARELCDKVDARDADIFDAHLLLLEDQAIIDEVARLVSETHLNVESAFDEVACKFADAFHAIEDSYLRERAVDMKDVAERVIGNLLGMRSEDPFRDLSEASVIVGHNLSPSTTASLDRERVLGFATDVGSPTSHTAILARSLNLPAVVGLRNVSAKINAGEQVLIDGYEGLIIVNPSESTLFQYGQILRQHEDFDHKLESIRMLPAETIDKVFVKLMNNIDHPSEVKDVYEYGGEGVGLFRTEYLFLNRSELPNEEQQFDDYRLAARDLGEHPLLLRTLDLGADKVSGAIAQIDEVNPALGLRAIRYCLQNPTIFKQQLRAILRASAFGSLRLMYPMVTHVEEIYEANHLLDECRNELRKKGIAFDESLQVGVMIETPTAALIADTLALAADFISIGTNDLIQYASAADRLNERVAPLYQPTHPGIVRLIEQIVRGAQDAKKPVSVCGEMGGDPLMVPLLLGLGIRQLSVSAPRTPHVKHLIRKLNMRQAETLAQEALCSKSSNEVSFACRKLIKQIAPELLS